MDLTRRDALAALAAAGTGIGAYAASESDLRAPTADGAPSGTDDGTLAVLTAVAPVVYPSQVGDHREFVETYVLERIRHYESYREGVQQAAVDLDDAARAWYDRPYPDLPLETRESVLEELGVDGADPDPGGTIAERVRYYVVDDLLYALFASPAGGRLVGTENPPGHPGGIASYQRGPADGE